MASLLLAKHGLRRRLCQDEDENYQRRRIVLLPSFRPRMFFIMVAIPSIITSSHGPLMSSPRNHRGMAQGLKPGNVHRVLSRSPPHRPQGLTSPVRQPPPSSLAASTTAVPWIACASATELKRASSAYIRTNDTVLEIGAQLSDVSATICRAVGPGGRAVMVDVERRKKKAGGSSSDGVRRSRPPGSRDLAKYSYYRAYRDVSDAGGKDFGGKDAATGGAESRGVDSSSAPFTFPWTDPASGSVVDYGDRSTFVEVKRVDDWRCVLLSEQTTATTSPSRGRQKTFDALVVDLGSMTGNDLPTKTLSLVQDFVSHHSAIFQQKRRQEEDDHHHEERPLPRVILVKSASLSNFARRLHHARRIILDDGGRDGGGDGTVDLSSWERGSEPHLVASVGVDEYRGTIPKLVRRGDAVLEVGCHLGVTTAMLHDAATEQHASTSVTADDIGGDDDAPPPSPPLRGFAVGVDVGPRIVEAARKRHPCGVPRFVVGDAWHTAGLLRLRREVDFRAATEGSSSTTIGVGGDFASKTTVDEGMMGYDVVYVDVGGLSGPDGLLESLALLDALGRALEPRCVVVKSLCVRRLASCLTPFSEVWSYGRRRGNDHEA